MSEKRCQYMEAVKRETVRMLTGRGYGVTETARELGIKQMRWDDSEIV